MRLADIVSHPDCMFVDGEWIVPRDATPFDLVVASSEEAYGTVPLAGAGDMARAISAARHAFDAGPWPCLPHAERGAYLAAIAARVAARADDLATSWISETGVVSDFARAIVPTLAGVFAYHADLAASFPFEEVHRPERGGFGLKVYEPVGAVAAIVPWNFPLMLIAWKIAPALLAGCTIVLKASPEAPTTALVLAEIAEEVGLPAGVLNVVVADRDVSEALVRDPRIDKVTFTGSGAAGRRIAMLCGERIARCTLELGGKSAAVVLDDYDLERAARSLAAGAQVMTGQVCSSLTRVIVRHDRHDALVNALAAAFADIRVGDPFAAGTMMGPLAMARQRDRVEALIATGIAEGARLAAGGKRPAHCPRGFFVDPTVFAGVDNAMAIAREEIFGPVLSVIPADDEADALRIANDTPYGLNAAVFTDDPDRGYRAARTLRSGSVGQNGSRTDFTIGFGGFKQSGLGREGGTEGLRAFLESKTIVLDTAPSHLADPGDRP